MGDSKEEGRVGGYISEVTFNDGQVLSFKHDDIVVFVGPNNAGKSQALRDIYNLCDQDGYDTVVVSQISIKKDVAPITEFMNRICTVNNDGGYKVYSFLEGGTSYQGNIDEYFRQMPAYGWFRQIFVAKLSTDARLATCNPANSIRRDDVKTHPIHYAAFDAEYRKRLSDGVLEAFGSRVTPNILYGSTIPLCLGDNIKYDDIEFADEQERFERFADDLSKYKQIQDQGDGIRSFVGILLYLMMDNYRTYLIDEPESFLHPPQAHLMGKFMAGDLSRNQQIFLSTHSEELIKGLLEEDAKRIRIVRITRCGDKNAFAPLDNKDLNELWKDPILKYSNIMSGLFYDNVVLCESDADCKIYSLVNEYMKQCSEDVSSSKFIHCGGKQRMDVVIRALKSLKINVKVIADMDVLDDCNTMKKIFCACGGTWSDLEESYNVVYSGISESGSRSLSKGELKEALENSIVWDTNPLTKKEIEKLRSVCRTGPSPWKNIKRAGVHGIPSGNASLAFGELDRKAKDFGMHIVPVGELEGFVRDVGGHGPDWVNSVLRKYPDFSNPVYGDVKKFLSEMGL